MGVYRVHSGGTWGGLDRTRQLEEELMTRAHLRDVVAPGYTPLSDVCITRCRIQLAIERSRVPFRHATVVIGAQPAQPWYFNGRDVEVLDGQGLDIIEELERLRRGAESAASPHWLPAEAPRDDAVVPVVVPSGAESEIDGWEHLWTYLQAHRTAWSDDDCAVFELPTSPSGPDRSIERVQLHEPLPPSLLGRHIEQPASGATTRQGGIDLSGWVVGRDQRVISVRASSAGEVVRVVVVGLPRPDVSEALADAPAATGAATSGFHLWVDLSTLPVGDAAVAVDAILADGESAPLGVISVRRHGQR